MRTTSLVLLCLIVSTCAFEQTSYLATPSVASYDTTLMVLIPAGTFRMGNITDNEHANENQKPVHEVTISRAFLMSRTEVTQAQWESVMGNNPSHFKGDNRPVEIVNWYDALAFCNALSLQEGLDACYSGSGESTVCDFTANGYRLPTEAEWEYACRGGTETDFYTGNMTHSGKTPLDPALDLAGWFSGNANSTTHPVALKEPNSFGLYDMHGNMYEWCWDWFSSSYYGSSPGDDPRGPGYGSTRVLRGGSWGNNARNCRSAPRNNNYPSFRHDLIGFRFVRTY